MSILRGFERILYSSHINTLSGCKNVSTNLPIPAPTRLPHLPTLPATPPHTRPDPVTVTRNPGIAVTASPGCQRRRVPAVVSPSAAAAAQQPPGPTTVPASFRQRLVSVAPPCRLWFIHATLCCGKSRRRLFGAERVKFRKRTAGLIGKGSFAQGNSRRRLQK